MSASRETIAIDANPLLSVLRSGKAKTVLFSGKFVFITTEHTTWEVKKYIPELSQQAGVPEQELFYVFDHFPITTMPAAVYDDKRAQAEALIAHRDPKDIDLLALALKFSAPLWTNDKDFSNLPEVTIFSTAEMLEKLTVLAD